MSVLLEILKEEYDRLQRHEEIWKSKLVKLPPEKATELKKLQKTLNRIEWDKRSIRAALDVVLLQAYTAETKAPVLLPCPICHHPALLEEGLQEFSVSCSENCPAPRCAHFHPEHVALSWNDFARWFPAYVDQKKE